MACWNGHFFSVLYKILYYVATPLLTSCYYDRLSFQRNSLNPIGSLRSISKSARRKRHTETQETGHHKEQCS